MKPTKKNSFFTFIFSFLPGAAEMYMGFMKNGFSLMAVFALLCALLFLGPTAPLVAIVWFYGFFHARNLAKLDDASFAAFEDVYVWEEFEGGKKLNIPSGKLRTGFAVVLLFLGVSMIWSYVSDIVIKFIPEAYWDYMYPAIKDIPSLVVAIILIVLGIVLIRGKKKTLTEE